MEQKEIYSTSEVARMIGIKPHQLKYAIENGDVQDAASTFLGKRVFTQEDIERFKKHFEHKEEGDQ